MRYAEEISRSRLAGIRGDPVCRLAARVAAVIRVDEIWLAVDPLDMRAGFDTALARVVNVFGAAHRKRSTRTVCS
ncbi:hypothetical protein [Burkholderia cenocepacia]|uniref:hypothetical protein n=1 Tax=Burkholderia cenocepacia TaxID=95486 RepID=UPI002AAFF6B3|nr:hypothetical protein [Burkholderia cenocepacia]